MEEDEMLYRLGKKIDKLIDKEFDKRGIDRAYYSFHLDVDILNHEFSKIKKLILIDDDTFKFCKFCGAKTHFYSHDLNAYICAACLGAYHSGNKKNLERL